MKTLKINEEVEDNEDFVLLLEEIKRLIAEGYTSGYCPTWKIEEVQDDN